MPSLKQTIKNIQTLKIQGANAVAENTLKSLLDFGKKIKAKKPSDFLTQIKKAGNDLAFARPTEPMAQNLVEIVKTKLKVMAKQGAEVKQLKEILDYIVNHELRELEEDHKQLTETGAKVIDNNDTILTFCHSSSVEKILIAAKKQKKKFKVIVPETRPLFQGRITARKLSKAKINVTMIVDSKTDQLLHKKEVDKVLIGADVILKDGSIINKVGSFGICEDAFQHRIPVYVAAVTLKRTKGKVPIKIEKRHSLEIWKKAPKNITIENPAFDKVPKKFITGIITERGIIK
ncbi:S-methyl-5-thioribose-1-phosphate isomerase [Candidatus Falkowbacteria bacterium]|nr:S-methyl-5-thioribose-1-phosphate isomerase [Candidatus Falkowbacteria bacterium]